MTYGDGLQKDRDGFKEQTHANTSVSKNVIANIYSRMFERSSEWKLIENVFEQIVTKFGKPNIDLFASRINYQLPNCIPWRPDVVAIN